MCAADRSTRCVHGCDKLLLCMQGYFIQNPSYSNINTNNLDNISNAVITRSALQ